MLNRGTICLSRSSIWPLAPPAGAGGCFPAGVGCGAGGSVLLQAPQARGLRDEGFDGEIHLIGAEAQLPYNRPPLSKGYLRRQERFESIPDCDYHRREGRDGASHVED